MDIITYHASDMDIVQNDSMPFSLLQHRREYTGKQARQTAVAANMGVFSGFDGDSVPYTSTSAAAVKRAVSLIQFNPLPILLIFSILYAILAVPLLRNGAGAYSIRTMHFSEEPSFSRALHAYIFPEHENFSDHDTGVAVNDYVSAVTFKDYTVKKGDTVSGIASGAGLRNFGTLLSVNNIDNARRISVGQVLRIPSADGLLYTVKKGETLAGIAAAHNVSVTALLTT